MRYLTVLSLLCGFLLSLGTARGQGFNDPSSRFLFRDRWGHMGSAPVMRHFTHRIVHPGGQLDPRIDTRLLRAATIAQERANAHSKKLCWRYVKEALLAAGAVNSYPQTSYACQAGDELVNKYGFKRLSIRNPYAAPLGAVLVYGGHGAGHVEIRTKNGFVSDYHSNNACFYHLIAAYAKYGS
jgi:hypothetical protein